MALSVSLTPSSKAMVGMPIKLSINTAGIATYAITVGGSLAFTGSGEGNFFVFIQDIIRPFLTAFLPVNGSASSAVQTHSANTDSTNVSITVTSSSAGETQQTVTLKVYLGGVSRAFVRSLGSSNIFTQRFENLNRNFFLTSRTRRIVTNGVGVDYIVMRETEIYPLHFIYSSAFSVRPNGSSTLAHTVQSLTAGNVYSLDIAYLRKYKLEHNGILANYFHVGYVSGSNFVTSCYIVFLPSQITAQRLYLRFLDSLGNYDLVECCGTDDLSVESEAEDPDFASYDAVSDSFVTNRDRLSARRSLSVSTDYKDKSELMFLLDLLQSDDVVLLDYHGKTIKVHPRCDDFAVRLQDNKPGSLHLTLTFADDDEFYTDDDISYNLADARIFTDQFTHQFV